MRRKRRVDLGTVLGLLLVCASACPPFETAPPRAELSAHTMRDPQPSARPQLSVMTRTMPRYGAWLEVTLRVGNPTTHPIAVLAIGLSSVSESVIEKRTHARLPAQITADTEAIVSGRLFVEDIGAAARLPSPPRWVWEGEQHLVGFAVLAPGAQWEINGRVLTGVDADPRRGFAARDRERLTAWLRYVPLEESERVWRLVERSVQPLAPTTPANALGAPGRWVATLQAHARFRPGALLAVHEPVAWSDTNAEALFAGALPTLYPNALIGPAFDRLQPHTVSHTAEIALASPLLSLEKARRAAEVASGPAVYVARIGAWVLEDDPLEQPGPQKQSSGSSVIVTGSGHERVRGRLAALAMALARTEPVTLTLYENAPRRDPQRLVEGLRSLGLDAENLRRKDGSWEGRVAVHAVEILRVARALARMGHPIAGLRATD